MLTHIFSHVIDDRNLLQGGKMKKEKQKGGSGGGADKPLPDYIASRLALWDKLKKQYDEEVAQKPRTPINVTLPDGKVVEGKAWESSPYDIAKTISQGLADATVIAKVNDVLWDLDRPLEGDCNLQLIKFDNPEGQAVFWHSSAHILGEAMETIYGGHLCYGPPIENGFYYDMYHEGEGVSYTHIASSMTPTGCLYKCHFTWNRFPTTIIR